MDGVFNHTGREFLHFRILSKTESSLHTAAGIKESISDGTALIMMDLDMKHGEIALSW